MGTSKIVKRPNQDRQQARAEQMQARAPARPGLVARELAVAVIDAVLAQGRAFDEAWRRAESGPRLSGLEPRDRAFARMIVATVLRRLGRLDAVLAAAMAKPLPAAEHRVRAILLAGAAQLLFIETPAHAAISLAVDQCRLDHRTRRFDKLVNAVLRRVTREGAAKLAEIGEAPVDIPPWLMARWRAAYGEATAAAIAAASLSEAPLDLSVVSDAQGWAEKLGGTVLPTGSVRLAPGGRIADLAGYQAGAWWVQDAAAALPAKLIGDVAGLSVADLCAAPGGKTAELAVAGAHVTAVDQSAERLERLAANLQRLNLTANVVTADAAAWQPGTTFDAVLVDAPCTATGTIRRHPDILRLRRETDIAALAVVQARILDNAARMVKPGGRLVYCSCSLQPEEGDAQVARFLAAHAEFSRLPVQPGEAGIAADWITADGDLRTLPCHMPAERAELSGLDGFYCARMVRTAI